MSPKIEVSPVIFVRSPGTPWFEVASREVQHLPPKEEDIVSHLTEVAAVSTKLEAEIGAALPCTLVWSSLDQHYTDQLGFGQIPGVRESRDDEYVVVTGRESHYIRQSPSVPACPYHNWDNARVSGKPWPTQAAIAAPSTSPRVWFPNPAVHHCAHSEVETIKAQPVTSANRARCGTRRAKDNQAFCEIRMFEQHLCCRTCVFEDVCEKAVVFQPPCQKPAPAPAPAGI